MVARRPAKRMTEEKRKELEKTIKVLMGETESKEPSYILTKLQEAGFISKKPTKEEVDKVLKLMRGETTSKEPDYMLTKIRQAEAVKEMVKFHKEAEQARILLRLDKSSRKLLEQDVGKYGKIMDVKGKIVEGNETITITHSDRTKTYWEIWKDE